MIILTVICIISLFFIVYHFIIYPLLLVFISKVKTKEMKVIKTKSELPTVSFIIAAHNEEKVIESKIKNTLALEYDKEKIEIMIVDDFSDDETAEIIKSFEGSGIIYLKPDKHLGKTYGQNYAVKKAKGEILVFSDANTMWYKDALLKLIKNFNDESIGFVAGNLVYLGEEKTYTEANEKGYWNYELKIRSLESDIKSIMTSNGAIYGVKKDLYIDINPLYCHDSYFPPYIVSTGHKAIFEQKAIVTEKAVYNIKNEFSRKVRMFGRLYSLLFEKKYNSFLRYQKTGFLYRWMFFSHRQLRFMLPLFFTLFLITFFSFLFLISVPVAIVISVFGILVLTIPNKIGKLIIHFFMTMIAMLTGFYKYLTGKIKPYWDPVGEIR